MNDALHDDSRLENSRIDRKPCLASLGQMKVARASPMATRLTSERTKSEWKLVGISS